MSSFYFCYKSYLDRVSSKKYNGKRLINWQVENIERKIEMKIELIINELKILEIINPQMNTEVKKIAYNSKDVQVGTLFVAIPGYVTDGHKYVSNAITQGARVVVHQNSLTEYN